MAFIPYLMVLVLVLVDGWLMLIIQRKRNALNDSTPEGREQRKRWKIAMGMIAINTVILAAVLLVVLRPVFAPGA